MRNGRHVICAPRSRFQRSIEVCNAEDHILKSEQIMADVRKRRLVSASIHGQCTIKRVIWRRKMELYLPRKQLWSATSNWVGRAGRMPGT